MRFTLMLLLLALMIPSAFANETGSLFGVVTDRESGMPIAHANVVVEGTLLNTLTLEDGSYFITGIQPGEYTVRAMMFGYTTQEKYRIQVEEGSSVEVNFALEEPSLGN
jgi:hypothetical protein